MSEENKQEKAPEEKTEKVEASVEQEEKKQEEEAKEIKEMPAEPAEKKDERKTGFDKEAWQPRTLVGKKIKSGEIKDIDEIIDKGIKILEPEVAEALVANLETDLLLIGQSKGKFGGGQRRVFKQTQKKTREGNKPRFATAAVAGNKNGYVGVGGGKAKETVPAREKALRQAKLNVFKIRRGCGSWQCGCGNPHSIPFKVEGKCGSVKIKLIPAPRGKGLIIEKECQKILRMAGIEDVWSKTTGRTGTKTNLIGACVDALKKLMETKIPQGKLAEYGVVEGAIKK